MEVKVLIIGAVDHVHVAKAANHRGYNCKTKHGCGSTMISCPPVEPPEIKSQCEVEKSHPIGSQFFSSIHSI